MLSSALRSLGATLEKAGQALAGSSREVLSRHREVMALKSHAPSIHRTCFVAPSANVVGNVKLAEKSSIWYGAIVRGDLASISIGSMSSIADKATISPMGEGSVQIGNRVLVGQGAVVGVATIHDDAVIGMGSTIGDRAVIESGAYIAPGSVVASGTVVPKAKLFCGEQVLRDLTPAESARLASSVESLCFLRLEHAAEVYKDVIDIEQDKSDAKWMEERSLDYDSSLGLLKNNERAQVW
ncbi:hypothetical protein GUITHDRAFT_98506 [Guillardia theta CCMP2712]|uniref:Gamma carbonic anhydrase n=2 Tax=Guillardia theta TaxID=55529 RepID=L1IAE0_GUITC|nr:hypothetical protein GUITHDRAFT_98506 [Guillardia theta CCMP2712]EKX32785.1 hypothetical protein GUITHDRAFT_98506 [Guillardia theta CCMP2712]|eukprot:XP_005819765.1 hypothetical protein GUITHDRAFT_98506 [Guillardia theta CCMP2712]